MEANDEENELQFKFLECIASTHPVFLSMPTCLWSYSQCRHLFLPILPTPPEDPVQPTDPGSTADSFFSKDIYWCQGQPASQRFSIPSKWVKQSLCPRLAHKGLSTPEDTQLFPFQSLHPCQSFCLSQSSRLFWLGADRLLSHCHAYLFWTPPGCLASHLCRYVN